MIVMKMYSLGKVWIYHRFIVQVGLDFLRITFFLQEYWSSFYDRMTFLTSTTCMDAESNLNFQT